VAVGVLYPVFGVLLSLMLAALAISLSSVSVAATLCGCATRRCARTNLCARGP
jgi:hypothetical protein